MPWEIDYSTCPPSCFPKDFDKSNLADITRIGDPWKRYIDLRTNQIHNGIEYFKQMQKEKEAECPQP